MNAVLLTLARVLRNRSKPKTSWRRGAELAAAVVVPQAIGGASALASGRAIPEWYSQLEKPPWAPPKWLFGPAWTLLYVLMGIASWLVLGKRSEKRVRTAIILYGAQLAANGVWTPLFFRLRRPDLAFAEIVVLWQLIAATTQSFWRISPAAGILLLPYLAWTTFAAALNLSIWRRNGSRPQVGTMA